MDEVDGDETDGKTASQWRSLKRNHPLEIMVYKYYFDASNSDLSEA